MDTHPPIVCVSLNPAIDQTAWIPQFKPGTVTRVIREQSDAAGKGVNVASFLRQFGFSVTITGWLGDGNSEPFARLFQERGIDDRCLRVPGRTRVNVKVVDESTHQVTDINFPGLTIRSEHLDPLFETIDSLADRADWFVLSGSVPTGVPVGIYADLVARLRKRGKTVVLDASGAPFAAAIAAAPSLIKPNVDELSELTGGTLHDERAVAAAARGLVRGGIALVAVSMGARGAVFVERDAALVATPPPTIVETTVGAGDAMVAGLVTAALRGLPLADRARLATAFAVAALGEIGPRLPPPAEVERIAERVTIRSVESG